MSAWLAVILVLTSSATDRCAEVAVCRDHARQLRHAVDNCFVTQLGHRLFEQHVVPRRAAVRTYLQVCRPYRIVAEEVRCQQWLDELVEPEARLTLSTQGPIGWRRDAIMQPVVAAYWLFAAHGCLLRPEVDVPWEEILLWVEPGAAPLEALRRRGAVEAQAERALGDPAWAAVTSTLAWRALEGARAGQDATQIFQAANALAALPAWHTFCDAYWRDVPLAERGARCLEISFVQAAAADRLIEPLTAQAALLAALAGVGLDCAAPLAR